MVQHWGQHSSTAVSARGHVTLLLPWYPAYPIARMYIVYPEVVISSSLTAIIFLLYFLRGYNLKVYFNSWVNAGTKIALV